MAAIDRNRFENQLKSSGLTYSALETIMGIRLDGEIDAATKRSIWEIIKSPEIARIAVRVRAYFPEAIIAGVSKE